MDFRHLIVTCLFSMLRLSFETQKIKKNYAIFLKNVLVFLLLPMHRKPSFCGGTDLSCVLFAGKKPKTPYFISSRNDL